MNEIKQVKIKVLDIIEIITPQDFIIIKLIDQESNKKREKSDFPNEFNLNKDSDDHCVLLLLMLNRWEY